MNWVKYLIRIKKIQGVWERLFQLALYGMNFGPIDPELDGEVPLLKKLGRRFPPDCVLFDIGANRGDYTKALVRYFAETARIFSFEPSVITFSNLANEVGETQNIRLENFALGDEAATLELFYDKKSSPLASLHHRDLQQYGLEHGHYKELVKVVRLDDYCRLRQIDNIDLLKLDVEGHELAVLKGCGDFLAQGRIRVIQFEFGGCAIDSRIFLRDFFRLLTPRYTLFRMVADGLVPLNSYDAIYEKYGPNNFVATTEPALVL